MRIGTGFLGKLPGTGDFVSRGLSKDIKRRWDFLTSRLASIDERSWPQQGLRFREQMDAADETAQGVLQSSVDRVGRSYPIVSLIWTSDRPLQKATVDVWADAAIEKVHQARTEMKSADWLASALDALPLEPDWDLSLSFDLSFWVLGRPEIKTTFERFERDAKSFLKPVDGLVQARE